MNLRLPVLIKNIALTVAYSICLTLNSSGQQQKIQLTGFTADVIADSVLNTSPGSITTNSIDGISGNVLYAQGYSSSTIAYSGGLPDNRQLISPTGHYFQLQPYNANNSLRLLQSDDGTLTFAPAYMIAYDTLFVMANAGGGGLTATYQVNFTDNSTYIGTFFVADWFCTGCTSYAINNLGRAYFSSGTQNGGNNFAIGEYTIVLSSTDRLKQVASVEFIAEDCQGGVLNIYGITGAGPSVLPVSLKSFTASLRNGEALLQWKTAQELNSKQFILDRAVANSNAFTQIGKVVTNSSLTGSSYSFTDKPTLPGTYLYRLSQQDVDGNIKILGIRSLTFNGSVKWLVQDLGYQWQLVTQSAFNYKITDINGKVLQSAAGSGNTAIAKPLAKGIYFIQVWEGGESSTQKIIN